MTESTAKVRWQTCTPGAKAVLLDAEAGGGQVNLEASETPYNLQIKKTSIFKDVPPDYAGKFYL